MLAVMAYRNEQDREHRLQYAKEVREYRKALGICTRCGNDRIAVNSKTLCADCQEKRREYAARQFKGMTPEEKQQYNEQRRIRRKKQRDQHKAAGQCECCGKPTYNGHSKCIDHFLYHKRKEAEHRNQKKKGYAEMGLCRYCGGECVPGKAYCPEHYQQKVESIRKAGECRNLKKHTWAQDNNAAFRGKE